MIREGENKESFIAKSFQDISDLRTLFNTACAEIGDNFENSKCVLIPLGEKMIESCVPLECSAVSSSPEEEKQVLKLSYALSRLSSDMASPLLVEETTEDRRFEGIVSELRALGYNSVLVSHSKVLNIPKACVCL